MRWISSRRVALGISEHAAPSILFVMIGMALGPELLNVISVNVYAQLDPVISITLAILGVYIGLGYADAQGPDRGRWVSGAIVQAAIAFGSVTFAMYFLLRQWGAPLPVDIVAAAYILGICSMASAAVPILNPSQIDLVTAAHLADFDDLAVLVLATFAVPALAGVLPIPTAIGLAVAIGLIVDAAGRLLFAHAHSAPERGVFILGTVVLLGGAAAYADVSPLVTGFVASLLWARQRVGVPSSVEAELNRLQHPLIAIVLIIAGTAVQFSYVLLWIAAPLILFRLAGKLLGSLVLSRWFNLPAAQLATILISPGVLGIALALNFQQVLGTGNTVLVSAVVVTTVISEVFSVALGNPEDVH